jgi:hypothetical protein
VFKFDKILFIATWKDYPRKHTAENIVETLTPRARIKLRPIYLIRGIEITAFEEMASLKE